MRRAYSPVVWYLMLLMVVMGSQSFIHVRPIYRYTGVNLILAGLKGYPF